MAFMMPVVKNDWDIYKTGRSRRSSECSNPQSCPRSRKVSECSKSEGPSLSTSPGSDFVVGGVASPGHHRSSVPVAMSSMSRQISSRASSRASLQSPCKSASCSPPKAASLHAGGGGHHGGGGCHIHQSSAPAASASASQSSLNKFHSRLVDKLKRSVLRKESTVTPPPAGAVAAS